MRKKKKRRAVRFLLGKAHILLGRGEREKERKDSPALPSPLENSNNPRRKEKNVRKSESNIFFC